MTVYVPNQFRPIPAPNVGIDITSGIIKADIVVGSECLEVQQLRHDALMCWNRGDIDSALIILKRVAQLSPKDSRVMAEIGCLLSATSKPGEAVEYLRASVELDENHSQTWISLASVLNQLGEHSDAEQAYLAAVRLDTSSIHAFVGIGLLYFELRRFADATENLERATQLGADSFAVHACLGQAYYALGNPARSNTAFLRAHRLAPDEKVIKRRFAVTTLIMGVIHFPVEEAIASYHRILGASDADADCQEAFYFLSGYGWTEPAIRLGECMLRFAEASNGILAYHVGALKGESYQRAPLSYIEEYFDKFAPTFETQLVNVLDYHVPETCDSLLRKENRTFQHIIDLGCGTGLAAPYLSAFGGNVSGVDISSQMLKAASARDIYSQLLHMDIIDFLKQSTEAFDLAVALDLACYFGELAELFELVAGNLSPCGVFCFSYEIESLLDYKLLASGRFAHRPAYVDGLLSRYFEKREDIEVTLRLEANQPVAGRLVVVRRASASC